MRLIWGPYLCKDGRMRCDVMYRGRNRPKTVLWARFKLEKKLGRPLRKGETVDHKNEDKTNDRLSNLQVLTLAGNSRKSARLRDAGARLTAYTRSEEGRRASKDRWEGQKNLQAKFDDKAVMRLRNLAKHDKLDRKRECARYNVTDKALRNALSGISYSHLPGAVDIEHRRRIGRPLAYTDEQIAKWAKRKRKGYTWAEVADFFGVNITTVIKKSGPLV